MASTAPAPSPWPVLKSYSGPHLARVALPIGGIGTGTVSLGGRGDLRDFEIVNRPAKGFTPGNAFFAVQVHTEDGTPLAARCLEGPLDAAVFEGSDGAQAPNHGLPRFADCRFDAAYPLASVHLSDSDVPVTVRLDAFNPLIPADVERSSYPVAVLRYVVRNPTDAGLSVSICGCLPNFIGNDGTSTLAKGNRNEWRQDGDIAGLFCTSDVAPDAETWGTLTLAAITSPQPPPSEGGGAGDLPSSVPSKGGGELPSPAPSPSEGGGWGGVSASNTLSHRTAWARKSWNGGLLDFWDDFSADGELSERQDGSPIASLCQKQTIEAGGEAAFTFLIAWHFPNRQSWTPEPDGTGRWADKGACRVGPPTVGNWYTKQFSDAWDAAQTVARDLPGLEADTVAWVRAFCDSDLPPVVKEAALFNVSTLRTQTLFRLPDGNFYGWEGMHDRDGSCFGSCTHVWEKTAGVALLFGDISRNLRETEFLTMTDPETGHMAFRVGLPTDKYARKWGLAAADGQMGCLMRLYLDWQICGDDDWLRRLWPNARKALEFCWIKGGWDADRDGVMEGCQHNTMDVEYYGPNPQMASAYLGALRACEEMARHLGEADFADECRRLFENGSQWVDANLFNGDYYEHHVVPPANAAAIAPGLRHVQGAENLSDPELQLGAGCLIDQLGAQSTAHVCGLGHLLNPEHVRTTLQSVFRYNFKENLRGHFNHLRTFALQDESACLMATYPHGRRPMQPFPYYNEVMTGFEYIAAVGMLYEGLTANGLRLIEAIRARYDGRRRSPFDEAECGHHYARAMVSWSATLALTGYHYSAVSQTMTFAPAPGNTYFWSNGSAWGTCQQEAEGDGIRATLRVGGGTLRLKSFCLSGYGEVETGPHYLSSQEELPLHVHRG